MNYCWAIPAIIVALCFAMFPTAVLAQGHPTGPKIRVVFTMEKCGPCKSLKRTMFWRGIKCKTPTVTKEQPQIPDGLGFPAVAYETPDGKNIVWDNGENIINGNFQKPDYPVTLVHWLGY